MISSLQIPCVIVTISANKTSAYIGDVIALTVNTDPVGIYTIIIRDQHGNFIGYCDTDTNGTCTINWDTKNFSSGTYTITAAVGIQCFNTIPIAITLQPKYSELLTIATISAIFAILYIKTKHKKKERK